MEDEVASLKKTISDKDLEILVLQKLNEILKKASKVDKDTINKLRSRLLSEFRFSTEQLYLFDEIENTVVLGTLEETPEDAPVVDIYDDSVIETCPRCDSVMKEVGEKI